MTSAGFVLIVVSFVLAWMDSEFFVGQWVIYAAGVAAVLGLVLSAAGIAAWLWRVMP